MFTVKLLTNLVVGSDCYIVLNMIEHVFTFHISHITWGINYDWLLLKAVNVLHVYVQFKRTNQSCHLQKLSNQSLLNSALVKEIVNNSFNESKKDMKEERTF